MVKTSEKSTSVGDPRRRPRQSAEQTQAEILDAAGRRLAEGGPDALRLQDIARDVGISHPTILHHFGSRDGLMEALERRATSALTEEGGRLLELGKLCATLCGRGMRAHLIVRPYRSPCR